MSEDAGAGRVFVFGSANHDHVLSVEQLPQPGETILAQSYAEGLGGKGANQAVAAAIAGGAVVFVGAVGVDDRGDDVVANFAGHGIDTRWTTRTADEPTGRAFVLVDAHGTNEIIVAPGANAALTEAVVDAALAEVIPGDVIVVQCEIPVPRVEQVILGGARRAARVIVNLAPFTPLAADMLAMVGLLIVNESEARALVPSARSTDDLAASVAAHAGCACVVTLGERGSSFASPDGRTAMVAAAEVDEVVDTTGAGDVYVGSLAAALAGLDDIATAMRSASAAAARSVSRRGAQARLPPSTADATG